MRLGCVISLTRARCPHAKSIIINKNNRFIFKIIIDLFIYIYLFKKIIDFLKADFNAKIMLGYQKSIYKYACVFKFVKLSQLYCLIYLF